jgi:Lrp/AsnC family transcriptional regulator for asnA, asnC and gidA
VTPKPDGAADGAGRLQLGSEDLDELDAAIFEHLQEDGRRAYRAIAQDLGVPEATVRFRVNRLVREGIVHLTATIHPQRLGGLLVTLLIRVQVPQREAVISELSGWPEVMYLSSCTGRADLMLQVVTGGLRELSGLLTERLEQIKGVTEVETLIELEVVKAQYAFPPSLQGHRSSQTDH